MNAIRALNAYTAAAPLTALHGQPLPPPIGARPARFGNGRIELQVYPGASAADRIAAAVALLRGTGFSVTKEDAA